MVELVAFLACHKDLSPLRAVCELEGAGAVREAAVEQDGRRLPS